MGVVWGYEVHIHLLYHKNCKLINKWMQLAKYRILISEWLMDGIHLGLYGSMPHSSWNQG